MDLCALLSSKTRGRCKCRPTREIIGILIQWDPVQETPIDEQALINVCRGMSKTSAKISYGILSILM